MKAGWQAKTLGETCQIARGGSPRPIQEFITDDPNGVNWVKISDATASGKFIYETKEKIKPSGVSRSRLVKPGDFLLSNSMSFGRPYIMQTTGCIHDGWLVLSGYEQCFDQSFLYHLLGSPVVFEQFDRLAAGSTVRNLNIDLASRVSLPVPPLSEQHRIVAILDEAFDGIATAKANAEKNLHNARDLFESYLQSVFTQRGEGWVEEPLESLIESSLIGLTRSTREQGDDKKYPYVKMNHITRDNRFEFTDYVKVDATIEEADRFVLKDGDFLFNTRNSHELVGKSCIYTPALEGAVLYNNNLMRIRFKSGIDARFVLFAFSCRTVAEELEGLKSGTTNVSAIYFKDLRNLRIPLPPTAKQERISDELIALSGETQRLESLYQRKLVALDALKQSLLHQAFSGQL